MSNRIILIAVLTLAAVLVSVIAVFLYGLFVPQVDNGEILKILGPAFQMIVGAFTGLVGGYKIGVADRDPK